MPVTSRAVLFWVVACLSMAAQTQASAAKELRLPALKKFYLDTVLVSNGVAKAVIIAPDDPAYAELAHQVSQAVLKHTGTELPIIIDVAAIAELEQPGGNKRAMIVLGNLSVNKVSERLYVMEHLDVDAGWPGQDGYLVQTIHDPMADGRNFISLGGSDFKGVKRATMEFIKLLKPGGKSMVIGRLFKLESLDTGPAPLPAAAVNQKGYGSPEAAGRHAVECGYILRKYRTPGYGKMFRNAIERISTALNSGEKFEERFPAFGMLPLLWDCIEESEQFDERDLVDMILQGESPAESSKEIIDEPGKIGGADRAFISEVLYKYAQTLQFAIHQPGDPGPGKNTSHAGSALYAGLYFDRYYSGLEIGRLLLDRMDRYFLSSIKHWRVIDNATGYGDAVWYDNLQFSLLRPNMTYFSSGIVRKAADYHIIITSNCGRSAGFGDSLSWTKGHYNYHPVMFPMAAWYYRDGSYLWWFKKCGGKPGAIISQHFGLINQGRYLMTGLDEKPPVRWLGVKPYPLDHWMYYDWGAQQPEEKYAREYFDKMSYRAGFDPNNQYLLISGFSGSAHGHPDSNAIINFSDNGCDFLDDTGYMIPDITEHTTLIIYRNGMGSSVPGLVRLNNIADFNGVAFTETSVSGYNGARWARNIIWEKERYFVIIDEVEAQEDGEFGISCIWRARGNLFLNNREMTAKQGENTMSLINLDGLNQKVETHSGGGRLFQTHKTDMTKGQKTIIKNLILVTNQEDSVSIEVENLTPGAMLVKSGDAFTLLGIGPCAAVAGLETDAALFHIGPGELHACGLTQLSLPGFSMRAEKPVSVSLDLEKGTGLVEAVESAQIVITTVSETALNAGPGPIDVRFAPVSRERIAERITPLAGLFAAKTVARHAAEAKTQVENQVKKEKLKSRVKVIWECRNFQPSGDSAKKAETKDLAKLIDTDDFSDLSGIMNTLKNDGLERVEAARSETEGRNEIRWLEIADRDEDGKSEILAALASGFITSLSHEGKPLWSTPTVSMPGLRGITGAMRAVIGPLNNRQIITASGNKSWFLSCIDADGERLWEAPFPVVPLVLFASEPNTSGEYQIGMAAFEYAYGFSNKGKFLWKFLNQEKHRSTCGTAFDLDNDGEGDMIFGNDYSAAHVCRGSSGQRLMSIRMTGHAGPSAVAMGDLDGDRKGDMVIGDRMGHTLFCVPWNTENRISLEFSAIVTFVKFADIDGDGKKEVFIGTDSGVVYAFDAAGKQLFHGDTEVVPRDIDFGDVDGNGRLDLLLDCVDNCLRIMDDEGTLIARFTAGSGVYGVRAVELDGDTHTSEFVVGSNDGCVYALRFKTDGTK